MRELRIGVLGRINAGKEAGRVVEIVDDAARTGGFVVFTYADTDRSPDVFDAWMPSIVEVDLYFDDCSWKVEWLDGP